MVLQVEIPLVAFPNKSAWLINNKIFIEPSMVNSFNVHGKSIPMTNFYCLTNRGSELSRYLLHFIQLIGCLKYESNLSSWYMEFRKNEIQFIKSNIEVTFKELYFKNLHHDLNAEDFSRIRINGSDLGFDFIKYYEGYFNLSEDSLAKQAIRLFYLTRDVQLNYIGLYNNSAFFMTQYLTIVESIIRKLVQVKNKENRCIKCNNVISNTPEPLYKLIEKYHHEKGFNNNNTKILISGIKKLYSKSRSAFVHGLSHYNELEVSRNLMDKLNSTSWTFEQDLNETDGKASWLINIEFLALSLILDQLILEINT